MLALLALLLVQVEPETIGPPAPSPPSLAGYYAFTGRYDNGDDYSGLAMLSKDEGENSYRLTWVFDSAKIAVGTVMLDGEKAVVGWGMGGAAQGVGVYKIHRDGERIILTGRWQLTGGKTGTETLTFLRRFTKEL